MRFDTLYMKTAQICTHKAAQCCPISSVLMIVVVRLCAVVCAI
jgi:hypothetical protein